MDSFKIGSHTFHRDRLDWNDPDHPMFNAYHQDPGEALQRIKDPRDRELELWECIYELRDAVEWLTGVRPGPDNGRPIHKLHPRYPMPDISERRAP
jgi:hypothetical protein